MEKEVAAHQYLANLISLAENTVQERDHLILLVISFRYILPNFLYFYTAREGNKTINTD